MPRRANLVEPRVLFITLLAIVLGVGAGFIARLLVALIALVTNIAFYGRWSTETVSPAGHHLGLWVIVVPVIGGLIVGMMARYGSRAIRGHGIPEAMEQVLLNESRRSRRASRSSSRCRPRSRSAPAGRSAPRARSSRPAARSARSSASCCTSPATSARRCSPPARRRHGGDVRLAGVGGAARGRAAAVRTAAALAHPGGAGGGRRRWRALRVGRRRAGVRDAATSPQPGGRGAGVLRAARCAASAWSRRR